MAVQVIGVLDYSNRLSDVVLFVDFSLNAYADAGVRERELAKWMAGVPELVRTEAFYKGSDLKGWQNLVGKVNAKKIDVNPTTTKIGK